MRRPGGRSLASAYAAGAATARVSAAVPSATSRLVPKNGSCSRSTRWYPSKVGVAGNRLGGDLRMSFAGVSETLTIQ